MSEPYENPTIVTLEHRSDDLTLVMGDDIIMAIHCVGLGIVTKPSYRVGLADHEGRLTSKEHSLHLEYADALHTAVSQVWEWSQ